MEEEDQEQLQASCLPQQLAQTLDVFLIVFC